MNNLVRKPTRVLCIALIAVILFALTACATPTPTPKPNAATPTPVVIPEIEITVIDEGQTKWSADLFTMKELAKAGGVTFKFNAIAWADSKTKYATLLASQTLPDVFYMVDGAYDILNQFGPKGVFMALDEYIPKMPNLTALIAKHADFNKVMKSSDGKIYAFPQIADYQNFDRGPMVREKSLTDAGFTVEKMKTLDDYFNALKAIKEKTGTAVWVSRDMDRFVDAITPMFGTGQGVYYNFEAKAYQFGPEDDNYKIMIDFLRKCYAEGIIHPDIFQMTDQTFEQTLMDNKGHFVVDNLAMSIYWGPNRESLGGLTDQPLVAVLPPEINGKRYYPYVTRDSVNADKLWFVSAKSKYIDYIVKMVDWGYSELGAQTLHWGTEGIHFQFNAKKEREFIFKESFSKNWPKITKDEISFYDVGLYRTFNDFLLMEDTLLFKQAFGEGLANNRKVFLDAKLVAPPAPRLVLTQDEVDKKLALETPINTTIIEGISKFITGVKPMSEFDAFVESLKGMNSAELVAIYNTALARIK